MPTDTQNNLNVPEELKPFWETLKAHEKKLGSAVQDIVGGELDMYVENPFVEEGDNTLYLTVETKNDTDKTRINKLMDTFSAAGIDPFNIMEDESQSLIRLTLKDAATLATSIGADGKFIAKPPAPEVPKAEATPEALPTPKPEAQKPAENTLPAPTTPEIIATPAPEAAGDVKAASKVMKKLARQSFLGNNVDDVLSINDINVQIGTHLNWDTQRKKDEVIKIHQEIQKTMDIDRDGRVGEDEVTQAATAAGVKINEAALKHFIAVVNQNNPAKAKVGDAALDKAGDAIRKLASQEYLGNHVDSVLTANDVKVQLGVNLNWDTKRKKDEVQAIHAEVKQALDRNHDGNVSAQEIQEAVEKSGITVDNAAMDELAKVMHLPSTRKTQPKQAR